MASFQSFQRSSPPFQKVQIPAKKWFPRMTIKMLSSFSIFHNDFILGFDNFISESRECQSIKSADVRSHCRQSRANDMHHTWSEMQNRQVVVNKAELNLGVLAMQGILAQRTHVHLPITSHLCPLGNHTSL